MRTISAITLVLCAISCKPAPVRPTEPLAVQAAPSVRPTQSSIWDVGGGVCENADWRRAMLCDDSDCAIDAVTDTCATCVRAAVQCMDDRSDGCRQRCVECLGEARCEFHDPNLRHVESLLESVEDGPSAERLVRIGVPPVSAVIDAAPDGSAIVAAEGERGSQSSVVLDLDGNELWRLIQCPSERPLPQAVDGEVSDGDGHWYSVVCGEEIRVYELATGFLRFTFASEWGKFGGDRYFAYGTDGGLQWVDLLTGESKSLGEQSGNFALSRDGQMVALSRPLRVVSVDAPQRPVMEVDDSAWAFAWDGPDKIAVLDGRKLRRYNVETGVADEVELEDGYQWKLFETPLGAAVVDDQAEDDVGLLYRAPNAATSTMLSTLEPPLRGNMFGYFPGDFSAANGWAVLEDGRVVVGSSGLGMVVFAPDGTRTDSGLSRGPVLWLHPGGSASELVYGTVTGPRTVDIETGARERLPIPQAYQFRDVRIAHGRVVALGADLTGERAGWLNTVWVGERDGTELATVDVGAPPFAATLDSRGRLHAAIDKELRSFDTSTKRQTASVKVEFATRVKFSADGEYVVAVATPSRFNNEVGPPRAVVYKTADYSVVANYAATSCAFAPRTNVLACIEPTGDRGQVDIVSYEMPAERVLARLSAITSEAVSTVSDDGKLVATAGEFTWWRPNVLWDLKEALLFDADGDQLTFSADHRLIAADREFIAINPALNAH